MNRRFLGLALFAVSLLIFGVGLHAQAVAIAEINGVVTDSSGKSVPNAQVSAVETDKQTLRATVTDTEGHFVLSNLPVGPYRLEVKAPGFKDYRQTGITLAVGQTTTINVPLSVGAVTETVEVVANAAMVETKDSAIAQVMEQKKIVDLPLNGRNLTQLLTLTGGGTTAPAGDLTGSKNMGGSNGSGTFSVAGSQANGVSYLLDGGDNNDSFSNVNLPIPFPDAVQEFSVQTNALQAQYGLHPGGAVNIVTKSGSNALHGDLFEFLRNYDLNARTKGVVLTNPATGGIASNLQPALDSLKRSQYGGTVGGKIIRDKLFFFAGYQQTTQRSQPPTTTAHTPTALTLAGNFSVEDSTTCQSKAIALKDPRTGLAYPNNIIPSGQFDPAAVKLLTNFIPVSADPCGTYLYGQLANNPDWQVIGRVDYNRSEKNNLYGRYYIYNYTAQTSFDGKNALTTGPNPGNKEQSQNVTFGDTYTLSPTSINSFHLTFNRRADNRGSAPNLFGPQILGLQNGRGGPFADNMPDNYIQITVGNYFNVACGTCAPGYFNINDFQISDDYQKTKGRHQFAFGFDFRKEQFNETANQQSNGQWTFSGGSTAGYSGDNLADLLLGHMSTWNQGNALSDYLRQTVFAAYAQDTWRATDHLTVNIGLRWEPEQPAVDKQCRGNQFNLALYQAGVHSTQYPNAPAGLLFGNDAQNSSGCQFTVSHWLATSPRLGVVWDPTGHGKQTIRAAFGLMHDSPELFYPERWTTNPPYASAITFTNPAITAPFSNPWNGYVSPTGVAGDPFPGAAIFPTNGTYVSVPPNVHDMYTMQWNLSLSQQFGQNWLATATYIGNRTNHIPGANEQNPAIFNPAATCVLLGVTYTPCSQSSAANENARRPLTVINAAQGALYQSIVQTDDGNNAYYNGLLLKLEHRFASHYTWLTNYTWSQCVSTYDFGGELAGNNYQNPMNRRAEKADCNYDRRHIFNTSLVIESPGFGTSAVRYLTKDWQAAPIISLYSGQPFTVTTGADVSLSGVGADRPNVVSSVPSAGQGLAPNGATYLFNPNAFAGGCNNATYATNASCVPLGSFGNEARGALRNPGVIQWDMSLSRRFSVTERYKLEFRSEFFNFMNHANPNGPGGGGTVALTSTTLGQITTFSAPRLIQFGLKLHF